jgi:hypothetical protein
MQKLILVLATIFAIVTPMTIDSQELPLGDPRNPEFLTVYNETVALNPQIEDFYAMPVGAQFNYADGTVRFLGPNDQLGIWGYIYKDIYGVPFGTPVPPLAQEVMRETVVPTVEMHSVFEIPNWLIWMVGLLVILAILYLILTPLRSWGAQENFGGIERAVTQLAALLATRQNNQLVAIRELIETLNQIGERMDDTNDKPVVHNHYDQCHVDHFHDYHYHLVVDTAPEGAEQVTPDKGEE